MGCKESNQTNKHLGAWLVSLPIRKKKSQVSEPGPDGPLVEILRINTVGPNVRKPVFGGLQTTKAQTSLCISESD